MDMTHFHVLSEEDIDPIIAGELLETKEIERNRFVGWLKVGLSYPLLFQKVVSFLLGFPTT